MYRHDVGNLARRLAFLSEFSSVSSYGVSIDTDRETVKARKDMVDNFSTILRINAICTRRDPTQVRKRADSVHEHLAAGMRRADWSVILRSHWCKAN